MEMTMRTATLALALTFLGFALGSATALPMIPIQAESTITQVQLRCDQHRCIDPRTGTYGQSTCNARGCFPQGGPIGRVSPSETAQILGQSRARPRGWDNDERQARRRG